MRSFTTSIRVIASTALILLLAQSAQASDDLFDWLEDMQQKATGKTEAQQLKRDVQLLTLESGESEMFPRISPDGKHLLVVSGRRNQQQISRRLLSNGDPLNLVTDDARAPSSINWQGEESVTFLSERGGDLGVWLKAANGKGAVRRLHRLSGDFIEPIVLSSGDLIAVRLLPTSTGYQNSAYKRKPHKLDFKNWTISGNETRLLHVNKQGIESNLTAGVNPALSPDGKRLVFSMQTGRHWHLFMVDVDGSNLIQLTNDQSIDVQPTWSPDGKWIAFTSNRGEREGGYSRENWDIWLIRRDGRHLTRVTHDDARDGAPAIGHNGRIYFHSDRKVERSDRKSRHVSGQVSGFHIWSAPLPARVQ